VSEIPCLVMMPFDETFDRVYAAVRRTVEASVPHRNIRCTWLKDEHAAGRITDDIIDGITRSALSVSDLTSANANVMWETGYAMAAGKPTILISQDIERLPFDLRVHRVHRYDAAALETLGPTLAEAVRQTLARYQVSTRSAPSAPSESVTPTVAATGSMRGCGRALPRESKPHCAPTPR